MNVMDSVLSSYVYPYYGAPVKQHAALKLILGVQDLTLGHINRRHIL